MHGANRRALAWLLLAVPTARVWLTVDGVTSATAGTGAIVWLIWRSLFVALGMVRVSAAVSTGRALAVVLTLLTLLPRPALLILPSVPSEGG